MKRETCCGIWIVACVGLLLLAPLRSLTAAPDDEVLAQAIGKVRSEEAATRKQAFEDVLRLGAKAYEPLLKQLVEPGKGEDSGVRILLHGLVARLGRSESETQRVQFAKALCAFLGTDAPAAVKGFVIEQLEIAGQGEAVPALAACLANEELADPACRTLMANRSAAATKALRDALPETQGLARVGVIEALGLRRDAGAVSLLTSEAASADAEVRGAAITALGNIGDTKAEPVLWKALSAGSERDRRTAFIAYLQLAEQLTADRKAAAAAKVCARALQAAPTASLRCAALTAAGRCGSATLVAAVLPCLAADESPVRQAALECLAGLQDPKTASAIVSAMKKAQPPVKAMLLRVMDRRKDPEAPAAIEKATKDPSAELRVTAFDLLSMLEDLSLEPTLLEAAKTGSEAIRPVALNAYLRLAELRLEKNEKDPARSLFTQALDLAKESGPRRRALRGLAAVASPESLSKVESFLEDRAVRAEALQAYVSIASTLAAGGDKQRGIEMLKKALQMSPPRDVLGAAVGKLRELGVRVDPARDAGFVTCWWVVGPYSGQEVDRAWPPESGVSLTAPVKVGDRDVKWRPHQTADPEGQVDLLALFNPNQNTTAYLYAEVTVERAQEVLLLMGSDDGLKVWLNGKLVHRNPAPRSLTVDQDMIKAHLEAGANKILVKVVNGGGGWGCCLRITDPERKPIKFEQKEQ